MSVLSRLLNREVPDAVRVFRQDAVIAAVVAAVCALLAVATELDGRALDARGWLLMAGALVPLAWRRQYPMGVLTVHMPLAAFYHALDYDHFALFVGSVLAIYTVSAVGPRKRTLWMAGGIGVLIALTWPLSGNEVGLEVLRTSGWILSVIVLGEAVRLHGDYIAAIRERAERAERTREQEAARRVAEERLRIARDLHDLLAHSITLIGVRASVASHVLLSDPELLDRAAVAEALDGISETCRDARVELRTTLQVLRSDDPGGNGSGPLPGLGGIPDVVRTAEAAGAKVELDLDTDEQVPPVASAAAFRIVQEALTNAVRHAGSDVSVSVSVRRSGAVLGIRVTDDGAGVSRPATGPCGFGITGMRERARSIGGTLAAHPRRGEPGFVVTAELPLGESEK